MKKHCPAATTPPKVPHEVVACRWEVHRVDQVVKDRDSEKSFNIFFTRAQKAGRGEGRGKHRHILFLITFVVYLWIIRSFLGDYFGVFLR